MPIFQPSMMKSSSSSRGRSDSQVTCLLNSVHALAFIDKNIRHTSRPHHHHHPTITNTNTTTTTTPPHHHHHPLVSPSPLHLPPTHTLPSFVTPQFKEFFRLGRVLRTTLRTGKGSSFCCLWLSEGGGGCRSASAY